VPYQSNADRASGGGRNPRAVFIVGLGLLLVATFDVWLLLIRPDLPFDAKARFFFGLLGVYTFTFGVLSASGLFEKMPSVGRDLTSPNPAIFLAGNLTAFALLQSAFAVALRSERTPESLDRRGAVVRFFAETLFLFLGVVLLIAFIIIYYVLIAPLAWLAYVIASAPLDSIMGSAADMSLSISGSSVGEEQTVTVKGLVGDHLTTLRNVLVAVPSLVLSLIFNAPGILW
jgi:hypothetical protein